MGKCTDCKRPKVAWVKKVRRLAEELLASDDKSDDKGGQGYSLGLNDSGRLLDELLKEIEQ